MFFIERIPKAEKLKYIQDYVDKINKERVGWTEAESEKYYHRDDLYRVMTPDKRDLEMLKNDGSLEKLKDLEKRNIFVKLYYTTGEDMCHCYSYQHAVIASFGDTSVKVCLVYVGCRQYYSWAIHNALEHIDKKFNKIAISNDLATNVDYIKDFMFPNIEKANKNKSNRIQFDYTNEYKNCIKEKLKKQKELIDNKFNSKVTELGLEK